MTITRIIMVIMGTFMLWSVIDKIVFRNKFGYGDKFEEGIHVMGPVSIAIVGFMCIAPVLGNVLTPLVAPVFRAMGADPSMFAGSILAIDMGGFPLAVEMAEDYNMAVFSGAIYSSMMGCIIVYTIPLAVGIIEKEDREYLLRGLVAGIVGIPAACFVGGLMLHIEMRRIICNLIPVIILAAILVLCLSIVPNVSLKVFNVFSEIITVIMYVTLAIAIFQYLADVTIIPGMAPIGAQLEVAGYIGITLAGAYPLIKFITKIFDKPLRVCGKAFGINEVAAVGIIATLANSLPLLTTLKDMNPKGKIVAIAFMVPAGFVVGDQLAYASATMEGQYIPAFIVSKLIGGVVAFAVALFMTRSMKEC